MRTKDIDLGANLFVRADDAQGNAIAIETVMENGFANGGADDHLAIHEISGTTGWSSHHIVVRIPEEAAVVTYGVALQGHGTVWLDNAELELAGAAAQITGFPRTPTALKGAGVLPRDHVLDDPANLDFEPDGPEATCMSEAGH